MASEKQEEPKAEKKPQKSVVGTQDKKSKSISKQQEQKERKEGKEKKDEEEPKVSTAVPVPVPAAKYSVVGNLPSKSDLKKTSKSAKVFPLPVVWFMGVPSSGKKTQARRAAVMCNWKLYDVAQYIKKSDISMKDYSRFRQGVAGVLYLPDDEVVRKLGKLLTRDAKTVQGCCITNFPRTVNQADLFNSQIKPPDVAIFIDTSLEVIMKRLSLEEGSPKADKFAKLEKDIHKTLELVSEKFPVQKIDGNRPEDEVAKDVREILNKMGLLPSNKPRPSRVSKAGPS